MNKQIQGKAKRYTSCRKYYLGYEMSNLKYSRGIFRRFFKARGLQELRSAN